MWSNHATMPDMPESPISIFANDIVTAMCECIAELDLADCLCFADDNDLCCDPIIGWGGEYPNCSGAFVNYIGNSADEDFFPNPCATPPQWANFEAGVTLCPPGEKTTIEVVNTYSECLMYLSHEVWLCLSSLACCNGTNPTIVVGSVEYAAGGFRVPMKVKL